MRLSLSEQYDNHARFRFVPAAAIKSDTSTDDGRGSMSESTSSLEDSALLDSDASSIAVSTTPLKPLSDATESPPTRSPAHIDAFKAPMPPSKHRHVLARGALYRINLTACTFLYVFHKSIGSEDVLPLEFWKSQCKFLSQNLHLKRLIVCQSNPTVHSLLNI